NEALALRKGIVESPRSGEIPPAEAKASLGVTYWALAQIQRPRKRDYSAALQNALRAESLLREAVSSNQMIPRHQERSRRNWGLAALEAGRAGFALSNADEGKKGFEQAIELFTGLVKGSPRNATYRLALQVASAEYGDLLLKEAGQPAEARRQYEVAVEQSRAL